MEELSNYMWVVFIGVILIIAAVWRHRGRSHVERNPELRQGYRRLVLGFVLWGSLPMLVMGLGLMTGGVTSGSEYFRPNEASSWVLASYATGVCILVLGLWWVFRRNGAQALVDHPGLFNFRLTKAQHVKCLAAVLALCGIVGMVMAFTGSMHVPYRTSQTDDGYTTVFTVYEGFWRVVAFAVLFLLIGAGIFVAAVTWIRRLKIPKWGYRKEASAPSFLLVFSLLWLSATCAGFSVRVFRSYQLVSAYRSGAAVVVEGSVHVLREQPESGHAKGDLIEINGLPLVVDYFRVTSAYKQTIAHGGALCEGTIARVWHHGGRILRLDVKR